MPFLSSLLGTASGTGNTDSINLVKGSASLLANTVKDIKDLAYETKSFDRRKVVHYLTSIFNEDPKKVKENRGKSLTTKLFEYFGDDTESSEKAIRLVNLLLDSVHADTDEIKIDEYKLKSHSPSIHDELVIKDLIKLINSTSKSQKVINENLHLLKTGLINAEDEFNNLRNSTKYTSESTSFRGPFKGYKNLFNISVGTSYCWDITLTPHASGVPNINNYFKGYVPITSYDLTLNNVSLDSVSFGPKNIKAGATLDLFENSINLSILEGDQHPLKDYLTKYGELLVDPETEEVTPYKECITLITLEIFTPINKIISKFNFLSIPEITIERSGESDPGSIIRSIPFNIVGDF